MNRRKIVLAGDLFSGDGGLSLGAEMAGAKVIFASDSWGAAAATYTANHHSTDFFECPIKDLDGRAVMRRTGIRKGELDVLLGGPPCQGFSIYAPFRSRRDKRNLLILEYLRLAKELLPKYLVMENVPGLLSLGGGHVLDWVYERLGALGYNVQHRVLLAARYGVPQERWRLIVLARRSDMPEVFFPSATHRALARANFSGGAIWVRDEVLFGRRLLYRLRDSVTVKEAIGDLPPVRNGAGREVV